MKADLTRRKEEEKKGKGKEGASLSAPKVVEKGAPKGKADGKDDHLSKKVLVTPREKHPKKTLPPKPSHGVSKGLMIVAFHFQALVLIKALQDKCVAKERVISRLGKRNKTLTNEQAQYKDVVRTLNKEVTELKEKLKEEASQR